MIIVRSEKPQQSLLNIPTVVLTADDDLHLTREGKSVLFKKFLDFKNQEDLTIFTEYQGRFKISVDSEYVCYLPEQKQVKICDDTESDRSYWELEKVGEDYYLFVAYKATTIDNDLAEHRQCLTYKDKIELVDCESTNRNQLFRIQKYYLYNDAHIDPEKQLSKSDDFQTKYNFLKNLKSVFDSLGKTITNSEPKNLIKDKTNAKDLAKTEKKKEKDMQIIKDTITKSIKSELNDDTNVNEINQKLENDEINDNIDGIEDKEKIINSPKLRKNLFGLKKMLRLPFKKMMNKLSKKSKEPEDLVTELQESEKQSIAPKKSKNLFSEMKNKLFKKKNKSPSIGTLDDKLISKDILTDRKHPFVDEEIIPLDQKLAEKSFFNKLKNKLSTKNEMSSCLAKQCDETNVAEYFLDKDPVLGCLDTKSLLKKEAKVDEEEQINNIAPSKTQEKESTNESINDTIKKIQNTSKPILDSIAKTKDSDHKKKDEKKQDLANQESIENQQSLTQKIGNFFENLFNINNFFEATNDSDTKKQNLTSKNIDEKDQTSSDKCNEAIEIAEDLKCDEIASICPNLSLDINGNPIVKKEDKDLPVITLDKLNFLKCLEASKRCIKNKCKLINREINSVINDLNKIECNALEVAPKD
ncbi:hypothetical protein COBT_000006 [Conglomerata obtusa]